MKTRSAAVALLASVALAAPGLAAQAPQDAGAPGVEGALTPAGPAATQTPQDAGAPGGPGDSASLADRQAIAMYGYSEPRRALADLDPLVAGAMREWSVPGLALAIVADGRVIVSKGYGHRNVGKQLPVTPDTLFPIASLTKPITATVLATLVDEGLLEWDRPIVEYMPDFQLKDGESTRLLTARDLLSHQSGLPRHDFVWYGAELSREELFARLQFLEASALPRAEWQYQNLMFMAAGRLAERVTGASWEQLVRQRILEPLAMDRATMTLDALLGKVDVALPYAADAGGFLRRVAFRSMDPVGPAGSIAASAGEMSRFVAMQLAGGSFAGRRVISAAALREMRTPYVALPDDAADPLLAGSSYGLGQVISEHAGRPLLHHEGAVDGFVALMSMLPDEGLGVVVLTNYSGDNPVPWVVTRSVYDRLLEIAPADWIAYARDVAEAEPVTVASEPALRRLRRAPAPLGSWRRDGYRALPIEFAGTYANPAYGEVAIVHADGDLWMRFHGHTFELAPAGRNRYVVAAGELAAIPLTFFANAMQRIEGVAIPWEPAVDDIVFLRRTTADKGHEERR